MRNPRPHDLLQVDGLDGYLPTDAPDWVKATLQGTAWVVVLRIGIPTRPHYVGVRGTDLSQRYALIAPDHCVVDTVVPEDVAGVRGWPTRNVPALQALRDVRAALNRLGLPWGPIGSVGFELATGLATATRDSDLDLIIRLPGLCQSIIDELVSLHDYHFRNVAARVDCQVETPVGTISLTELVSVTQRMRVTAQPAPVQPAPLRLAMAKS